jgi:hypothetical protein
MMFDAASQQDPSIDLKWAALVHDCSVQSELTEISLADCSRDDVQANRAAKKDAVDRMRPEELFARAFSAFERGVFEKEKTLVHCTLGMSRSVTVVIAYLVKTFGVTLDEATKFVKFQRSCANSRFQQQLKRYVQLINPRAALEEKWAHTKQEQQIQIV